MTPRLVAQIIAAGRVLVGLALIVKPAAVTSHWVGEDEGARAGARVLGGGLGARDLIIGAGTLAALNADADSARPWLLGSVVADLLDLGSTLRSAGDLPGSAVAGTIVVAGGATVAGLYALSGD